MYRHAITLECLIAALELNPLTPPATRTNQAAVTKLGEKGIPLN